MRVEWVITFGLIVGYKYNLDITQQLTLISNRNLCSHVVIVTFMRHS